MRFLRALLLFVPLAFLIDALAHRPLLGFLCAALGLVGLSALLGEAIEALARHTGPHVGALLNATLGNAAELIITIVALRAGQITLVKAAITGAILGNLLVVPGLSMLLGGLKHGRQHFDRDAASVQTTMMSLSVVGLAIPTLFALIHEAQRGGGPQSGATDPALDTLSLGFAGILAALYLLSLVFSLAAPDRGTSSGTSGREVAERAEPVAAWGVPAALGVLVASSVAMIALSDVLVGAVEHAVRNLGFSELFLGVILIPLVGDVAEHLVGVQQAYRNNMDLSLAISLGSSTQIALFVAPLLVFVSRLSGQELTLFFSPFEVAILGLAVFVVKQIAEDGEANWLEGAQLLGVYLLAALGFLLL